MKFKQTLLSLAVSLALSATAVNAKTDNDSQENSDIKHVLLISVDGLRQDDLNWFVNKYPTSTLAGMVHSGISYNNASTPFPSDSFPGMVGQATGGNPSSTGIYYDDGFSRALLPLETKSCTPDPNHLNAVSGAEVQYAENIEPTISGFDYSVNPPAVISNISLDAGQGIANLYPVMNLKPNDVLSVPANILSLASTPDAVRSLLIDPAQLPVDPATCKRVYPHEYLQVNTIFEVAKAKGLHTAWSDKHPAYEILSGPSGQGIDDLFAPEINSVVNAAQTNQNLNDWTKDNTNTQKYDTIKVVSVINEINGYDHAGQVKNLKGTPAIFGMNFQAVSTAQKLNKSSTPESPAANSQLGGYNGTTPGPVIESALKFVDGSLALMEAAIKNSASDTVIIVSAKHGQSPELRSDLTLIDDGQMIADLETAWSATNPAISPLVAHAMDDDGVLLWLNDRSEVAGKFAHDFLLGYSSYPCTADPKVPCNPGFGSDAAGNKFAKGFTNAGLSNVLYGSKAAASIGVTTADQRVPDVIGYAKVGSVYAGKKLSKIAEHGGHAVADRHVPILISGASIEHNVVDDHVDTIQIAPSILHLLGLNPQHLQAVIKEGTKVLPGLN